MPADRLRRIASRQNALLKQMRQAFSRAELTDNGLVAIEGFKSIDEAIRSGRHVHAVLFSDAASARSEHLLPQLSAKTETVIVANDIFKSVVETSSPQGVAALVDFPKSDLEAMLSVSPSLIVMTVGLQDPGNLGTIIRAAEAFGATGLIAAEGTVSVFNQKALRASAGSAFRMPIVPEKLATVAHKIKERGFSLVGTSSHQGAPLPESDLRGNLAIVIGNEGAGLPKTVTAGLDALVTIPHSPKVESLNAAMAASLILYEAARQRRTFL